MFQPVRTLASKSDTLSLIPGTNIVGGKEESLSGSPLTSSAHARTDYVYKKSFKSSKGEGADKCKKKTHLVPCERLLTPQWKV